MVSKIKRVIVVAALIVLAVFPAAAIQEATTEAPVPDAPVVEPNPVDVVDAAGTAVLELVLAFMGGALTGVTGVLGAGAVIIKTIRTNDQLNTAIRYLYFSQPIDRQKAIRGSIENADAIFDGLEEITRPEEAKG